MTPRERIEQIRGDCEATVADDQQVVLRVEDAEWLLGIAEAASEWEHAHFDDPIAVRQDMDDADSALRTALSGADHPTKETP